MKWTLKTLYEEFSLIEQKFNLNGKIINGVFFWKLIRFEVFYQIVEILLEHGTAHPDMKTNKANKIRTRIISELMCFKYNALKYSNNVEVMLFMSLRKVNGSNDVRDIYISPLEKLINEMGNVNYETFEFDYNHRINKSDLRIAKNSSIYSKLSRLIFREKISYEDHKYIEELENEFNNIFYVNIILKKQIVDSIKYYKNKYDYYYKLLNKIKPNNIILENSYGNEALISSAQDLAIRVIEAQHGTISRYHVGYSFNGVNSVPYFPDKILMFGQYWIDSSNIPLSEENKIVFGFRNFDDKTRKFIGKEKKKKSIVILSQGTVAKQLINIVYDFLNITTEFDVTFKLHPSEYKSWRELESYALLYKLLDKPNFKIVDNDQVELHKILSENEYQIGVYSTSLYEGMALGTKTILIDAFGIENMAYLIEERMVAKAKNANDILEIILNFNFKYIEKEYFFCDVANQKLILEKLITK